jgi:ectoine hydroxylase-related dioxygenase (phytanoyl-CoA dioxygenase family)
LRALFPPPEGVIPSACRYKVANENTACAIQVGGGDARTTGGPELSIDRFFFAATGNAIKFLEQLEGDPCLRSECSVTDLAGRLRIAADRGFDFSEDDLRVAVRLWDYYGTWQKWLSEEPLSAPIDHLPPLDEPYPLTAEQIESYRREGHVLLRQVLSTDEIAAYRPFIRRVVEQATPCTKAGVDRELKSFEDAGFIAVQNLRLRDPAINRFAMSRRFARIAAELMNAACIRIHHDETFEKQPGGNNTPWHQDRMYFPPDSDELITMWMPIIDAGAEMGTLRFASRSHKLKDLGYYPIKQDSDAHFSSFIKEHQLTVTDSADMQAGDATFHNGWLLHGAPPNRTNRKREAIAIAYYPDGTRLCVPQNEYHRRAIELGFKAKPEDLAVSPINPIVYDGTQTSK